MTKTSRLEIRVPEELKKDFEQWCKDNGTTPSDELRRHMTQKAKEIKPAD